MKANKITNPAGQSKELHNWELWDLKKRFESSSTYISWKGNRLGANVEVFLDEMGYKIERLI